VGLWAAGTVQSAAAAAAGLVAVFEIAPVSCLPWLVRVHRRHGVLPACGGVGSARKASELFRGSCTDLARPRRAPTASTVVGVVLGTAACVLGTRGNGARAKNIRPEVEEPATDT
jgi:uncharacterized membrane protein YdfJ with MMPL/SSD domain